ncbi:hypothetical protein AMTRI_Chr06g178560 [Amborella trichopoda]
MEKAIIFNFNLTLPIIAITGELLLLMNSVRDTSKEVKEEQAATVMNAVRAEISEALNQMKREVIVDLEIIKNGMDKEPLVSCDQFGAFFFLSL